MTNTGARPAVGLSTKMATLAGKPEHCWRGMYYQIPRGLVQILATCEQGINIKRPIHRYSRTQQYQSTWSTAVVMQPADLRAAETKRIWILTIEYAYTKGVLCVLRLLSPGDFILCCRAVFGSRLLVFQPSSPSGQHICSRRAFSPQEAEDSEDDAGLLNKLNIKCYGMLQINSSDQGAKCWSPLMQDVVLTYMQVRNPDSHDNEYCT